MIFIFNIIGSGNNPTTKSKMNTQINKIARYDFSISPITQEMLNHFPAVQITDAVVLTWVLLRRALGSGNTSPKRRLKTRTRSCVSSMCWIWSSPTGTWVDLRDETCTLDTRVRKVKDFTIMWKSSGVSADGTADHTEVFHLNCWWSKGETNLNSSGE